MLLKKWMTQSEASMLRESVLAKASFHRINAANQLGQVIEDPSHNDEALQESRKANEYSNFIKIYDEMLNEHPFILQILPEASVVITSPSDGINDSE